MGNEHGEWIMRGMAAGDPRRLRTPEALTEYIDQVGFLPLFQNDIPGCSVEEHTLAEDWWSGDPARDPWVWREILSREGRVAYGKFFDRKACFISLAWFPAFANCRRDGYDYDARWEDELATFRGKKIMDLFQQGEERFSFEIKRLAGFGKGGEKGFEGTLTDLQMQTYLVARGFRQRINKQGVPYGWPIALYTTPEGRWGYDWLAAGYGETPAASGERILRHLRTVWPTATERQLTRWLR